MSLGKMGKTLSIHSLISRCHFAAILAFAVALSAHAAPTASHARRARTASVRVEVVTLWHAFGDKEEQAINTIAQAYNLEHRDQLRVVAVPHDGFTDAVEKAIRSGRGPDLFIWAHDKVGEWSARGLVSQLNSFIDSTHRSEYFANCLDAFSIRGKLYGLPLSFETLILYYNKSLVPHPPVNTDELVRLGKGLTDRSRGQFGLVYERGNFYHHAMWLHGFGGAIFDARGGFAVNSPEMKRSLEFARDLASVHGLVPDTVDWKMQMNIFNEGKAAMMISGPWAHGGIDSKLNLGMTILPFIAETQKWTSPFLGVKGVYVSSKSPRKRAAYDAAAFIASDYGGATMNILAGSLPANRVSYEMGIVASDPRSSAFKEQVLNTVPMPSAPEMKNVWKVMMTDPVTMKPGCIDRVFLTGASPDSACFEAFAEFNRLTSGTIRAR